MSWSRREINYIGSVKGGPGKIETNDTVSGLLYLPQTIGSMLPFDIPEAWEDIKKSENIWLMGLSCLFE